MSICRCEEIGETEKKIQILYKGKNKIPPFAGKKADTDTSLTDVTQNIEEASESDKVAAYRSNTQTLYNDMGNASSCMEAAIGEKIVELESLLESLKTEDEAFHEEERMQNEANQNK